MIVTKKTLQPLKDKKNFVKIVDSGFVKTCDELIHGIGIRRSHTNSFTASLYNGIHFFNGTFHTHWIVFNKLISIPNFKSFTMDSCIYWTERFFLEFSFYFCWLLESCRQKYAEKVCFFRLFKDEISFFWPGCHKLSLFVIFADYPSCLCKKGFIKIPSK